jgi:hypothetical protein
MTGWDDLPDDVQDVVSAFVRRNAEAELAEEAIRLRSLLEETASKLLKWRKGGLRSAHAWGRDFRGRPRFPEAQQARLEAEFRARDLERVRKLKESLFGDVYGSFPEKELRLELSGAFTAYVDRCTAVGIEPELTRPYLR